ncbi:MAG: HEAT repeat domain-containing protein [Elusimicrobiota bacterium]
MSKQERSSVNLRFILLWLLAGLLEAPLLALMLGWPSTIPAWAGVLMHILAAGLVFLAPPREKGYFRHTRHWGESLGIVTLFLPGIGWCLSGWVVLTNSKAPYDKEAYIFEDEAEEEVNPLAGLGSQEALQGELADALDVIPAVDALLSNVPGLKRGAIETLARIQSPEAISWLHKARGDDDPEVRFYATTALTRLNHDFDTAIRAAEREVYKNPGELPPQIALQRVRYEYACSGMLEEEAREGLLLECRARLTTMFERVPEAARLLYLVERRLDSERAFSMLDYLEKEMPEQFRRWTKERAELLFSLGRYGDARAVLRGRLERVAVTDAETVEDREWNSTLLWWAND